MLRQAWAHCAASKPPVLPPGRSAAVVIAESLCTLHVPESTVTVAMPTVVVAMVAGVVVVAVVAGVVVAGTCAPAPRARPCTRNRVAHVLRAWGWAGPMLVQLSPLQVADAVPVYVRTSFQPTSTRNSEVAPPF